MATSDITKAAAILRAGGLVALPTETVYGLGGDATSERAIADIFACKGRPRFNPLIVHVPGLAEAETLAVFNTAARRAAARFWPGPLSLVLPRRHASGLSLLASAGLDTVAVSVSTVPFGTFAPTLATRVMIRVAPAATVPTVSVKVPPEPVPSLAETKVSPAGKLSLTLTF